MPPKRARRNSPYVRAGWGAGLIVVTQALAGCEWLKVSPAQDYRHLNVSGVITSEATGAVIVGATVSLHEINNDYMSEHTTNAQGHYAIDWTIGYPLSKGCKLVLTVTANGYVSKSTNPDTQQLLCIDDAQTVSLALQSAP